MWLLTQRLTQIKYLRKPLPASPLRLYTLTRHRAQAFVCVCTYVLRHVHMCVYVCERKQSKNNCKFNFIIKFACTVCQFVYQLKNRHTTHPPSCPCRRSYVCACVRPYLHTVYAVSLYYLNICGKCSYFIIIRPADIGHPRRCYYAFSADIFHT